MSLQSAALLALALILLLFVIAALVETRGAARASVRPAPPCLYAGARRLLLKLDLRWCGRQRGAQGGTGLPHPSPRRRSPPARRAALHRLWRRSTRASNDRIGLHRCALRPRCRRGAAGDGDRAARHHSLYRVAASLDRRRAQRRVGRRCRGQAMLVAAPLLALFAILFGARRFSLAGRGAGSTLRDRP